LYFAAFVNVIGMCTCILYISVVSFVQCDYCYLVSVMSVWSVLHWIQVFSIGHCRQFVSFLR